MDKHIPWLLTLCCAVLIISSAISQQYQHRRYRRIETVEGHSESHLPGVVHVRSIHSCSEVSEVNGNQKFALKRSDGRWKDCYPHHTKDTAMLTSGTWDVYGGKCYLEKKHLTPFLRRFDGSVDFARSRAEYQSGFGDPNGEFWLGLDNLHSLTADQTTGLRVDIEDWAGNTFCATYSLFSVGEASDKYRLTIGGWDEDMSTASDSIGDLSPKSLNGMRFSTKDEDNDEWQFDCSNAWGGSGGWWYADCSLGDSTALYIQGGVEDLKGLNWFSIYSNHYSFKAMNWSIRN